MSRCLTKRSTADSESDPGAMERKRDCRFLRDTGTTRPFRLAGVSPVSRRPELQGDFNALASRMRIRVAWLRHSTQPFG
jgi:hypothetical protein